MTRTPFDPADRVEAVAFGPAHRPPDISLPDIDRSLLFTMLDGYGPPGWDIYRGEVPAASRY
ncbi:MAG TPA: hypothetical protein VG435_20380 [Acidimicrobiales bacterium]|nr:hypothetical protein [Acidimicrobiales bacterium]